MLIISGTSRVKIMAERGNNWICSVTIRWKGILAKVFWWSCIFVASRRSTWYSFSFIRLSQKDVLESVKNVYSYGKVCRVATGSNISGSFFSSCSFTSTLLELNKLAFERMLQEELSVKVVLKSSLWRK